MGKRRSPGISAGEGTQAAELDELNDNKVHPFQ
jgi:hypothetical protein